MRIRHLALAVVICLFSEEAQTQKKQLGLDSNLLENSTPLKVRRKGLRSLSHFYFGSYKVIEGKSGWIKTDYRSKLFGSSFTKSAKNKQYFKFINGKQDTLLANIANREEIIVKDENSFVFREIFKWKDEHVKKGQATTLAEFFVNQDTIPWSFALVRPVAVMIDDEYQTDSKTYYRGTVIKDDKFIEIQRVKTWSDGSRNFFVSLIGYELFMDSLSIGAVQLWPMNRLTVWINSTIDQELQLVAAATLTTLLLNISDALEYD